MVEDVLTKPVDTFANVQTATNFQQTGKNALTVDWVSVMTGKVLDQKFTKNPFDKEDLGMAIFCDFCTFYNFVCLDFA